MIAPRCLPGARSSARERGSVLAREASLAVATAQSSSQQPTAIWPGARERWGLHQPLNLCLGRGPFRLREVGLKMLSEECQSFGDPLLAIDDARLHEAIVGRVPSWRPGVID